MLEEVETVEATGAELLLLLLLLFVVVVRSFVCHNRIVESSYTAIDSPFGERSALGFWESDGSFAVST